MYVCMYDVIATFLGGSNFLSMRRDFVSYSQPIRFVRLDSDYAQSDANSVNRRLPVLDLFRGSDSWRWPKRVGPSGTRMGHFKDVLGLDLKIIRTSDRTPRIRIKPRVVSDDFSRFQGPISRKPRKEVWPAKAFLLIAILRQRGVYS